VRAGVAVAVNGTCYLPPSVGMCTGKADPITLHRVDDGDIPFSRRDDLRDAVTREHDCEAETEATPPDKLVEAMAAAHAVFCRCGPGNGWAPRSDLVLEEYDEVVPRVLKWVGDPSERSRASFQPCRFARRVVSVRDPRSMLR